jgi:hypothetical protein
MKQKFLTVLLVFCLVLTLVPTTAFALDFDVTINGTAVTDANADNVLGDGTVSYDAATNTLMLNGANLTQIQNNTGKAFTIKVSGNNTVAINTGSTDLIETNAPLTVTGDAQATLKLSGANRNSSIRCIDAQGSVTVESITLILTNSNNTGIQTTGDITIQNGATVKGDTGNMLYATTPGAGKLTVTDSTVEAPLEGTSVSGWMSAWVNAMEISNSEVDIVAANGIYATDDVVICNGSNVKVTADGTVTAYPGIYAGGSMTITDSRVEGVSYTYAGLRAVKDLTITNSMIKAVTTAMNRSALSAGGNLKINGAVTIETETVSGVSYDGQVIFEVKMPAEPADAVYDVYAGADAENAAKVEGSPFAANTDVTELVKDSPYFSIAAHTHIGGTATCKSGAICGGCGNEYGEIDPENHTNFKKVEASSATHLTQGNTEYWYCDGCNKYYSDEAGNNAIDFADTVIPKLTEHTANGMGWNSNGDSHWNICECGEIIDQAAHTFEWVTDKEATAVEAGSKHEECTICGYKKEATTIPATGAAKPTPTPDLDDVPKTGHNSSLWLWASLLLPTSGCLTGLVVYLRKRKTN